MFNFTIKKKKKKIKVKLKLIQNLYIFKLFNIYIKKLK